VKLRIPEWARGAVARINGAGIDVAGNMRNGYLEIRRTWTAGDAVDLELPMPVERIYAHPGVRMDAGRVALRRGPLIYCVEQVDNPKVPVEQIRLPRDAGVTPRERPDLLGGILTLVAEGKAATSEDWGDELYRNRPPKEDSTAWTAVPYYAWNNRDPGRMLVWIPEV
jgi:DUF1680 family protein